MRFIADQVASMPLKVYRRLPDGSTQRVYSSMLLGDEVAGGGPQVPGEGMYDWFFSGTAAALLHGTAWGLITNRSGIPGPDGFGLPTGIAWLAPDRMSVQDDEQQPENPLRARIYYNGRLMSRSELVMLRAFTVPGRLEGISPIRTFATLIRQGLEALDYSDTWFESGGFPTGVFKNISEEVDEQQARQIRKTLTDTIRLHQPLVIGRDWDYSSMTVPPDEAIFIKGMQLNATQVAAIYGVNPRRVGGTRADGLTYSNVTQDQLEELQSTLKPWLTRWEGFLTALLPATQFARFDTDALLKMDPHTRNQVYQLQRNMGTRTANEIRADDDKPSLGVIGDDPMPQTMLERMAATTRIIPRSVKPLVEFEADHIADTLQKMYEQHPELFNPATAGRPPVQNSPETYLGRLMTQVRGGPLFGPPGAAAEPSDIKSAITMLETHQRLGRLDPAEARARIARAAQAKTTGELAELFADMPRMPDGVAPSVPRRDSRAAPPTVAPFPIPGEPAAHSMFTAHRIDEGIAALLRAKERAAQATAKAGDVPLRRYHLGHVIRHLDDIQSNFRDLARSLPGAYPDEAKELAATEDAIATRAKSLKPAQKTATFAHLLQSVMYNLGHAQRHAQTAADDTTTDTATFDLEHMNRHLDGALEHVIKLAEHVRDNYPAEWGYLKDLSARQTIPADGRAMFGPGAEYRASDQDRGLARVLLEAHGRAGRLRGHEVDERSVKASEAVTCGDLDTLFADLPVIEMAAPAPDEDRSQEHRLMFGPAALALLHSRTQNDQAALAATNGKAH